MAMAFHRYPNVSDPNVGLIYRDAARHNIEAARSKLLRACTQLENAERSEAVHGVRLALVALDDALDSV